MGESEATKILFIDNDETTFQFRKCMARVLGQLPPIELFHASDATEALHLLEQLKPDVVVLDGDTPEERDLFLDSIVGEQPAIIVQSESGSKEGTNMPAHWKSQVTYVSKMETLEGIHQTLLVAASMASKDMPKSRLLS
jgi:DNA-binding NarL/FixJ family response regulator